MKWVGIAAALFSFAGTIYKLLQAQGDLRTRSRVVKEQVAAGLALKLAGDYAAAWESFAKAASTAQLDGLFAKLLGGLSPQQQRIRAEQEDLAMEWLRESRVPSGQSFADLVDKLINMLAVASRTASGVRKADLLAHLGWACFLKSRGTEPGAQPELLYQQAIDSDGANPYANAFWGHWILWNHGPMAEAEQRFQRALSTDRVREDVRRLQLAALQNAGSDADGAWIRVVNEMRKANEPLDADTLQQLFGRYYFALRDERQRALLFSAVPPAEHLELQRMLLAMGRDDHTLILGEMMALTHEANV